jgi:hypothetical protein
MFVVSAIDPEVLLERFPQARGDLHTTFIGRNLPPLQVTVFEDIYSSRKPRHFWGVDLVNPR